MKEEWKGHVPMDFASRPTSISILTRRHALRGAPHAPWNRLCSAEETIHFEVCSLMVHESTVNIERALAEAIHFVTSHAHVA
jgi:hypothetical protein